MDLSSQINPKPVELTEEQRIILEEMQWQLGLCSLEPSGHALIPTLADRVEAKINHHGEEGIAVTVYTDRGNASLFLPFSLYNDGFIHPSGHVDSGGGKRFAMAKALRLAADLMEQLDALDEETLSNGPRSQWLQRQAELMDGCY
jgi:hypothetical protein